MQLLQDQRPEFVQGVQSAVQLFALTGILSIIQLVEAFPDGSTGSFDLAIEPVRVRFGQGSRVQRLPIYISHTASWGKRKTKARMNYSSDETGNAHRSSAIETLS